MAQPRPPIPGGTATTDDLRFQDSFSRACKELWDQSVRADLIYKKSLTCCGDCLGMFYPSEGSPDHPEGQCFVVGKVCAERGITNSDDFSNALWVEALKLYSKYGRIITPRMAAKHEELPKTAQTGREMTATWNQARLGMLEQQVLHLQGENSKLQAENRTLQAEVNSLVESLISEKAFITKVKIKADRHLDALHCLLHSEGCGCIGECEKGKPHHP